MADARRRRRTLAEALDENELRATIARYRDHAAALFKRLAELEASGGSHDLEPLRRALQTCTDRIEGLARLVGATPANDLDWLDAPTLPRKRG